MTSRRTRETPADAPTSSVAEKPPVDSDVSPAVPTHVILKLLGFSVAMVSTPLGTYFAMTTFGMSPTVSGISAAIMANVILFLYIYVAWQEDKEEREAIAAKKAKKAQ
ncbi:vacuolar ATPase assembly integral membrane protein vma21 [Aspergillus ambiguus]|uniref:vacuolar ATPase assembly integral membrane protein VMA21 n=1 Tax=Aspergillus ambiguus TaxID=176160 RepID=UPI003CCE3DA6